MGGKIYRFASAEHLTQGEKLLEASESGPRPEPAEPASAFLEHARFPQAEVGAAHRPLLAASGTAAQTRVLVIRTDFCDLPGDPRPQVGAVFYTASSVQDFAETEIAAYYRASSYGKVTMTFTVTPQLYRLPQTAAEYATAGLEFKLYDDATAAAAADYGLTNYDKVLVLFSWLGGIPNSQIQFGALTLIGTPIVCINGEFDFRVVAHELGHTYGLFHANFWQTSDNDPISANGLSLEYSDPFDTMSANWGNDTRVDFNPWFKHLLNWIPDQQVQTVTQSGTYRVFRFDDARATGTLALKAVKDGERSYWISCRRNFADNPAMQHGAYVIWGYLGPHQSDLLGLGSAVNSPHEAALALGTALADPDAGLTISPIAAGGDAPHQYLDVQITFGAHPLLARQPLAEMVREDPPARFGSPMDLSASRAGNLLVANPNGTVMGLVQSAPSDLPLLRLRVLGTQTVLSWPVSAEGFVVEMSSALSGEPSWTPITHEPSRVGCSFVVTNDVEAPAAFFRLRKR